MRLDLCYTRFTFSVQGLDLTKTRFRETYRSRKNSPHKNCRSALMTRRQFLRSDTYDHFQPIGITLGFARNRGTRFVAELSSSICSNALRVACSESPMEDEPRGGAGAHPAARGSAVSGGDDEEGAGKAKSSLVLAAERIDRREALLQGFLRKKNSAEKWQRRYFLLLSHYWVYCKNEQESSAILCAMDVWRAGEPNMEPPEPGETESRCFSITWDRFRVFRASTPADALRWVQAIRQVQASRPNTTPSSEAERARALAGPPTPSLSAHARAAGPAVGSMGMEGPPASGSRGASPAAGAAAASGAADWDRRNRKSGGGDGRGAAEAAAGERGEKQACCRCIVQ